MSKKGEVLKDILTVLGVVGLVVVALAAPNVVQIFGPKYKSSKKRYQLKRSLGVLERKKLVSLTERNGQTVVQLTKNGKKKVLQYKVDQIALKKPKKWDKKWRIVVFDIPVKYNQARLVFANKLRDMGFELIQKSVWVSPYPCEDEIDFLKEVYEIDPYIRVITAESIDVQHDLIAKFKLA